MKKFFATTIFIVTFGFSIFSQSSEKITEILNTEKVTLGQIAYLAGTCGSWLDENSDYEEALSAMKSRNIISDDAKSSDIARLDEVTYMFMKNSKIEGGLMYKIFGSKRYAFKEMKARGMISQNTDPSSSISGHDAFGILNQCISE